MQRLPVSKIMLGAFLIPWWNRARFLKALGFPTLFIVTVWGAWLFLDSMGVPYIGWTMFIFHWLSFCVFAVTCHRLMLIEEKDDIAYLVIHHSPIIFRFLLWSIALYFIVGVIESILMSIIYNIADTNLTEYVSSANENAENLVALSKKSQAARYLASLPALYVLSRLSLVLPSIAVDKPMTMRQSWKCTAGNGMRVFLTVGIFPASLNLILGFLSRNEPTVIENSLSAILVIVALAIGIFALSLTYKEIAPKYKMPASP